MLFYRCNTGYQKLWLQSQLVRWLFAGRRRNHYQGLDGGKENKRLRVVLGFTVDERDIVVSDVGYGSSIDAARYSLNIDQFAFESTEKIFGVLGSHVLT